MLDVAAVGEGMALAAGDVKGGSDRDIDEEAHKFVGKHVSLILPMASDNARLGRDGVESLSNSFAQ